jgi:molybdopterin synthase catalytic subunit
MTDEVTGRAKGGIATAAQMTPEELKNRARAAAAARWHNADAEVAIKSGKLEIGDIAIPCAVMADGTRHHQGVWW